MEMDLEALAESRRIDPEAYPTLAEYAMPLPHPAGAIIGRDAEVQEVLASLNRPRLSNILLLAPPGSGKQLALREKIPTPTGWTTMGELEVGDLVLGQDGKPTRVTFLSEIDQTPELYDITFSDGSVVRADADHQWKVSSRSQREAGYPSRSVRTAQLREADDARRVALVNLAEKYAGQWLTNKEIVEIVVAAKVPGWTWSSHDSMGTYLKKQGVVRRKGNRERIRHREGKGTDVMKASVIEFEGRSAFTLLAEQKRRHKSWAADGSVAESVMTTRQMLEAGVRIEGDRANFAIRVQAPLGLPEVELPMDPYALGVWLGDGTRHFAKAASISSMDRYVIDRLVDLGFPIRRVSGRVDNLAPTYHLDGLGTALHHAGISPTEPKHIPMSYLRASYGQRLALLQGLLDTDGFIDDKGAIELSFSGEELARGAEELIRTLGIKVTRKVSEAGYRDEQGDFVRCQDRHRMHFTTDLPVFTLPRQAVKLPAQVRKTQKLLYIESIEPVPSEPARCIQVDNDDHMYLAGEGFVPTHNTVLVQDTMTKDPERIYLEVDLARLRGGVEGHQMAAEVKQLFDEAELYGLSESRELVLFIDELHQIVQMDAAAVEALKPVLAASGARGLKIIGATTYDEWITYIRPNKPLDERLQRVNLTPADRMMTIKILRSFADEEGLTGLHRPPDGLLGEIHDLTELHVPSSVQPRKSIGILDGMIGWHRQTGAKLDRELLAKVMNQTTGVDISFRIDGTAIQEELDKRVFAQQLATKTLSDQLQLVVADLHNTGRPKGRFLLAGSTGVGKSELTKQLVKLVFGDDPNKFIRFDMSEFALKESMELFRSELTRKVVSSGQAVVLLDEIEKADRAVLRLLLQVLDDGRLSDDNGRVVSFLDCYIIMTTNAGSEVFETIGAYAADDTGSGADLEDFLKTIENAIKKKDFPPELLGRLDRIIPFQPLSDATKRKILQRGLTSLRTMVMEKHGVLLGIHDRVIEYLAVDVGDDDVHGGGARESMRALQDRVTVEVAKFINANPDAKRLLLTIEGHMRAEDPSLRNSRAWPKVEAV